MLASRPKSPTIITPMKPPGTKPIPSRFDVLPRPIKQPAKVDKPVPSRPQEAIEQPKENRSQEAHKPVPSRFDVLPIEQEANVLESAGCSDRERGGVFREVRESFKRTKDAFVQWAFKKLAMYVAHVISHGATAVLQGVQHAHSAIELLSAKSLAVDIPIYHAPCHVDVMLGIPLNGKRPTVWLAPGEEDSPFGGIELEPADDQKESQRRTSAVVGFYEGGRRRAVVAEVSLSKVADAESASPGTRAAEMRFWAEHYLWPCLREDNDLELAFVYDRERRIGAWLRLSARQRRWCIVLDVIPETHLLTAKVVRIV
jgi:hypothetical protein